MITLQFQQRQVTFAKSDSTPENLPSVLHEPKFLNRDAAQLGLDQAGEKGINKKIKQNKM